MRYKKNKMASLYIFKWLISSKKGLLFSQEKIISFVKENYESFLSNISSSDLLIVLDELFKYPELKTFLCKIFVLL